MNRPLRIVITTGDADGIGSEVAAKALAKLGPQKGVHFILWRTPLCPARHLRQIDRSFRRIRVATWPEALRVAPKSHKELIDICSSLRPPHWVEMSASGCLFGHVDAIATAPLSKSEIVGAGIDAIGHTEILKRVSHTTNLFMAFVGKHFNVLLTTGHEPLCDVPAKLTSSLLYESIAAANRLRKLLPRKLQELPLGLVGLNPHAGESGLIGTEELDVFEEALKEARRHKIPIEGPLVPDSAFFKQNWSAFSVFVCPYHDQGLIPFKMIHGQDSGVHITMGLPFVRTSVDHGTAKNIFGKNRANPNSMVEAIAWAIRLAKHGDPRATL